MEALEERLSRACEEHVIPGAVVYATNTSGSFEYHKVFGALSISPDAPQKPLALDSIFLIASCTKLMTSVSALRCVEKGLIGLDDDVAPHLPELAGLEVLDGFDSNGQAKTKKRQNAITLRLLLTHSTGLGYEVMSPQLMKYRKSRNEPLGHGSTLIARFSPPLLFEPGTSWQYGPSIDWAGRLVERLTNKTLEEYMQENIWTPLRIKDMTFFPSQRDEGFKARMASLTISDPQGSGKVVHYPGPTINTGLTDCCGGQGVYGTMEGYIKVLHSLLADDERLLGKSMTEQLFSPQLTDAAKAFLNGLKERPEVWKMFVGTFPKEIELDWGLGGILTKDRDEGWRREGTLMWSGWPNLFWFIDRKTGVCGVFGTQVIPSGDAGTAELIELFEKTMYKQVSATAKI